MMLAVVEDLLVSLLESERVRGAARGFVAAVSPPTASTDRTMLTASQLARELGVSVATIRRLDPPHLVVGDASTKRFDLENVRAWLREREPAPTTPAKSEPMVDTSKAERLGGLRRVG